MQTPMYPCTHARALVSARSPASPPRPHACAYPDSSTATPLADRVMYEQRSDHARTRAQTCTQELVWGMDAPRLFHSPLLCMQPSRPLCRPQSRALQELEHAKARGAKIYGELVSAR
eukprot:6185222-Pleurochrysis_carterae.AAC.2